jgi:PqqD family protein of HPr-rel-A system
MNARLGPLQKQGPASASEWWNIDSATPLPLRHWDGEYVVFNPSSGHTHFLDFVAGSLLLFLSDQPRHEDELARLIAARLELPADEAVQEPLRRLLEQLEEQGLIAPTSTC